MPENGKSHEAGTCVGLQIIRLCRPVRRGDTRGARGSRAQPHSFTRAACTTTEESTMANSPLHIVLTGASRGLGLAMADGFIAAGHTVAGCTRSDEAAQRLATRWPAPHRFDVV